MNGFKSSSYKDVTILHRFELTMVFWR